MAGSGTFGVTDTRVFVANERRRAESRRNAPCRQTAAHAGEVTRRDALAHRLPPSPWAVEIAVAPSNIAEGASRRRRLPFVFHLEVALGSQAEVEVQLELANELGFVDNDHYQRLRERTDKVGRMLNRLIDQLRSRTTHH